MKSMSSVKPPPFLACQSGAGGAVKKNRLIGLRMLPLGGLPEAYSWISEAEGTPLPRVVLDVTDQFVKLLSIIAQPVKGGVLTFAIVVPEGDTGQAATVPKAISAKTTRMAPAL